MLQVVTSTPFQSCFHYSNSGLESNQLHPWNSVSRFRCIRGRIQGLIKRCRPLISMIGLHWKHAISGNYSKPSPIEYKARYDLKQTSFCLQSRLANLPACKDKRRNVYYASMSAPVATSETQLRHYEDKITLDAYSLPIHRLKKVMDDPSKTPVVLVCCGSFSPITCLHMRIFEMASDFVTFNTTFEVVGGYFSPVSDAYTKPGLESAEHR